MTDNLTVSGVVATVPRHLITAEGLSVTSFRLASQLRKFDRATSGWVDAGTNWYTVSTFRQLASNVVGSIEKGDRILVTGRLRINPWESGEKHGVNVDIEADALGHDLCWGTASFARTIRSEPIGVGANPTAEGAEGAEAGVGAAGAEVATDHQGTTGQEGAPADVAAPF